MKTLPFILITALFFFACAKKNTNTTISGTIQGLKKGVLYLEKAEDTLVKTIDSVVINGSPQFTFQFDLPQPQMLFLTLKKTETVGVEEGIEIFAEPGTQTIAASLENFETSATVTGSKNHDKLQEHKKLMKRYHEKNLELFEENFYAEKENNTLKINAVNKKYESLLKSKYMATVNFAINNKNYEVVPYIALREIYDTHVIYLDTIYNSLAEKVKNSLYGKQMQEYIQELKLQDVSN